MGYIEFDFLPSINEEDSYRFSDSRSLMSKLPRRVSASAGLPKGVQLGFCTFSKRSFTCLDTTVYSFRSHDHNNQFPCALLRTGFRFAFAQSAVLKGALFRKQRGQESQVRLTTITNHLVRCCRLSSGLILLNVVVQKGVVTETTRSGIASAPDLFIFARLG